MHLYRYICACVCIQRYLCAAMFSTRLGEELETEFEMCTLVQERKGEEKIYIFKIHHTSSTHLHKHARISFTVSFGCQSAENKQQNENQELILLRLYDNVLQHFPVFVFSVLN